MARSLVPIVGSVLALALASARPVTAAPTSPPAASPPAASPPAASETETAARPPAGRDDDAREQSERERDDAEAPASDAILDTVLPCGLRLIAARDASLPVAAVVLAIEIGTRDDPKNLPGLVHALAYHLQQGNRELAPGEAISTAHDVGGLAAMAVGWAQVRFESLVPLSQLDAQLRVESLRLRAPTIRRELWLKSLSYATNDDAIKHLLPPEAAAEAWQDPGMAHDGRRVGKPLAEIVDQALGAQLSQLYDYRRATLVVVGPDDPSALLARVEPLFDDLPPRPRLAIPAAETPTAAGTSPRTIQIPRQSGDSLLWAVPGNPRSRAWAQVLCGTLNRQQRVDSEAPKARVRCTTSDDARRPLLVLRAVGFDPATGPEPLIAGRLARIAAIAETPEAEPELAALIEAQRLRIETEMEYSLRTPMALATHLASAAEPADSRVGSVPRAQFFGLPLAPNEASAAVPETLGPDLSDIGGAEAPEPGADPTTPANGSGLDAASAPELPPSGVAAAALVDALPELFDTRRAVLLLAPDQDQPPAFHADGPQPPADDPPPSDDQPSAEPKPDVQIESVPSDRRPVDPASAGDSEADDDTTREAAQ